MNKTEIHCMGEKKEASTQSFSLFRAIRQKAALFQISLQAVHHDLGHGWVRDGSLVQTPNDWLMRHLGFVFLQGILQILNSIRPPPPLF